MLQVSCSHQNSIALKEVGLIETAFLCAIRRSHAKGNHTIQCVIGRLVTRLAPQSLNFSLYLTVLLATALSHFRQNPLQGAFKHSLFQGFSRIVSQVPYFLLPFVVGELNALTLRCFLLAMKADLILLSRIRHNLMGSQEERVVQVRDTLILRPLAYPV